MGFRTMKLQKKLEISFERYKKLRDAKEYFSAIEILSEIYNSIFTNFVKKKYKYYWKEIIINELKNFNNIDYIVKSIMHDEKRISRIITYRGYDLNEDEILLILTLMIAVDQIKKLLSDNDMLIGYSPILDLERDLISILNSTSNKKSFKIVKNLILKNSVLPMESKWI